MTLNIVDACCDLTLIVIAIVLVPVAYAFPQYPLAWVSIIAGAVLHRLLSRSAVVIIKTVKEQ